MSNARRQLDGDSVPSLEHIPGHQPINNFPCDRLIRNDANSLRVEILVYMVHELYEIGASMSVRIVYNGIWCCLQDCVDEIVAVSLANVPRRP